MSSTSTTAATSSPIPLPISPKCLLHPKDNRLSTPENKQKYDQVLEYFSNPELKILVEDPKLIDPHSDQVVTEKKGLSEDERMYVSRECILRQLTAEKWVVRNAIPRLEKHLIWRRTMKLDDPKHCFSELEQEFDQPKLFTIGYSSSSEPILYMTPSLHIPANGKDPSFLQVKDIVYIIERGVDLMIGGVEEISFIVDLSGKIPRSSAAISVMRQMLATVQTQYPERLGFAEVKELSWWGKIIVGMLWPFIDPYTKEKVRFDGDLEADGRVPGEMLIQRWGGEVNFNYVSEEYHSSLLKLCLERRKEEKERWLRAGGVVGLSEVDIKRGVDE